MRIVFLLLPLLAFAQIEGPRAPPLPPAETPVTFPLYSLAPYKVMWDLDMSPYAGGEDLLFVHRALERGEIHLLKKSPMAYSRANYARAWRLSELIGVWLPANYFAMVLQHEVFGHGYRIRDIDRGRVKVTGYSFGTPPPYGFGGGATGYKMGASLTTTEENAIASAGVEATAILAQLTKFKWLASGSIDPRQTVLYLFSQHDLNLYIGSLKGIPDEELDGHDIHAYVQTLNYTYPDNILSKGRLRSLSWINLADPFTFYAVYAWFHYLSSGRESAIPMIAGCYLPNLRLGLTPFGPEVFLENYVLWKDRPIYAYVKGGHHAKSRYYGVGLYMPQIYQWGRWIFGLRIDAWRQPKLLLEPAATSIFDIDFDVPPNPEAPLYSASERHAVRYGGAGSVIFWYRGEGRCGFESELGYKAQGFLPGYSLRAFPTVRLAFTLMF